MMTIRNVLRNTPIHYHSEDGQFIVGNVLAGHEMTANDPFLFMEDVVFPEGTFGLHPHRGIETITYVLEGEVMHHDTTHGDGSIQAGDVQWMTAGGGVLHAEEPAPGTKAHVLQLWLNLPAEQKMMPSNYQTLFQKDMPAVEIDGASVRIFSGEFQGTRAETTNVVPVNMYDIRMQRDSTLQFPIPKGDKAFAVLLDGEAKFGNEAIATTAPAVIHFSHDAGDIAIQATEESHLLFYSGTPLGEPIAARGPFVMNTREQLEEAFRDYREGKFHNS